MLIWFLLCSWAVSAARVRGPQGTSRRALQASRARSFRGAAEPAGTKSCWERLAAVAERIEPGWLRRPEAAGECTRASEEPKGKRSVRRRVSGPVGLARAEAPAKGT